MKPMRWLLLVSLGANVTLGILVVDGLSRRDAGVAAGEARPSVKMAIRFAEKDRETGGAHRSAESQSFDALTTASLHSLIATLRRAGFSPTVINAAITQLVRERFDLRRADLLFPEGQPFWKTGKRSGINTTSGYLKAINEIGAEQQGLLRSALGRDAVSDSPALRAELERRYGNAWPVEKHLQLLRLERDYLELQAKTYQTSTNPVERSRQMALLEEQKRSDLAKLFTAEELAEYDLRHSVAAGRIGAATEGIEVSEQEYRVLFRLQKEVDELYPPPGARGYTNANYAERMRTQQTVDEQIRTLLGDARYWSFLANREPAFGDLARLADDRVIAKSAVFELWTLHTDTVRAAQQITTDRRLSSAERTAALETLLGSSDARAGVIMGNPALQQIRRNDPNWLLQLGKRSAPAGGLASDRRSPKG